MCRVLLGASLAVLLPVIAPATGGAEVTTFGSSLSVPVTLNTAINLNYVGTDTAVPPSPDAPNGIYHTFHYGADSALWNVALASGGPASAPAPGQALKVSLEGCAQPAPGGPSPLTQIHFQDISPLPGGGATVKLSSQPFDIPVCGQSGAGGSTITTYEPVNLCVSKGDYIDLNDNGGYLEHVYQNGVPYQVFGSVPGSTFDSFIRGNGTGNSATMSSLDTTAMDGFASNPNEELMLQVTLGTESNAVSACGGTAGKAGPGSGTTAAMRIGSQTDGVNHSGVVQVALYCGQITPCQGLAMLTAAGGHTSRRTRHGGSHFSIPGKKTSHVQIRLTPRMIKQLRRHHGAERATLSVVMGGTTVTQTIGLRIF